MRTPVSRIEKYAGLFILLALVVLGAVIYLPGMISGRLLRRYQLEINADDGIGLSVGDKVMMQGIQVGEVEDLQLTESNHVLIRCKIHPTFRDKITAQTKVSLVPPLIFGSPRVKLVPGAGEPLAAGIILNAEKEGSITDQLGTLSDDARHILEQIDDRVGQLGQNMTALQEILDAVNSGEGLLGKIIHEDELYKDVKRILADVDQTLAGLEGFRGRLADFSGVLPGLKEDIAEMSASLRRSLTQVEKGLERFPELTSDSATALEDARRIIESLKRNFLVRPYLPKEPESGGMAPASYREPTR